VAARVTGMFRKKDGVRKEITVDGLVFIHLPCNGRYSIPSVNIGVYDSNIRTIDKGSQK
jgi:hypothetical protein